MTRQLSTSTLSMTGPHPLGLVVLENCKVVDGPVARKGDLYALRVGPVFLFPRPMSNNAPNASDDVADDS